MSHLRRSLVVTGTAALALASALAAPPVASAAGDGVEVRVLVLSPDRRPVEGVLAESMDLVGARTGADGRVVLHLPNPYERVSACAALDASTQHLAGPTGWADRCEASAVVDGVARVTVRFTVGAAIAGTLVDARTGQPVEDLGVATTGGDLLVGDGTDAQGRWLIPNLPAGPRYVYGGGRAAHGPDAPYGYETVDLQAPDHPATLRAGRITDIGVRRIAPLVRFTGTVVDGTGAPVQNANVIVDNVDGDPATPFARTDDSARSGADGSFQASVPYRKAPRRQICAYAEASADHPTGVALTCSTSTAPGFTVRVPVTAAEGGAVAGRITGPGSTGGATVTVTVRTAAGEDFVLRTSVRPGSRPTYRIDAVPAGTRTVVVTPTDTAYPARSSTPVTVTAGAVTPVRPIVLSPAS